MLKQVTLISIVALGIFAGAEPVRAQQAIYPALDAYLLPREAEIALARSAAPSHISERATIKVLTADGFRVAQEGNNGFCFDPEAVRLALPYYELRTKLGLERKTPEEIRRAVEAAFRQGSVPVRTHVSFAYLWSADQRLGPDIGHWHPHMMVFAPYYRNSMLGDHDVTKAMPFVSHDDGTPFTVVVIPVDDRLAIKADLP